MEENINREKVSVAMAVYNGETFLQQQIDSILQQLTGEDELMISYDESEDNTYSLLEKNAKNDKRIKIFVNSDHGVFGNFENAIKQCTGQYIFISDQDDIWDKDKINKVLQCFRKTNADMVIHNGVHISSKNEVISEDFFSMYGINNGLVRNFVKPRYSGCCTAFDAKLKELIVPIPRDVGAYDHWLGMVGEVFGKLVFIDDVLIYHRLHDENVTPTAHRPYKDIIKYRFDLLVELIKRRRKAN